MNKTNATIVSMDKLISIQWYVLHYTAKFSQQPELSKQILTKVPQYVEKSSFIKAVYTENLWSFELGTHEGINIPVWIIIGFQLEERQHSQNVNNDTFHKPAVTCAQFIFGTENYPVSTILLNYHEDDSFQGYGQIKEAFRALTKDDILKPYIYDNNFRSSNNGIDIGCDI